MRLWAILRSVARGWVRHRAALLAAGLAFYAVLALAPLLVIAVGVAGVVFGRSAAQDALLQQVRLLTGGRVADTLAGVLQRASRGSDGVVATVVGTVLTAVAATGVAVPLQTAFDQIWGVPTSEGGWGRSIRRRLLGLALVLLLGAVLMASLLVDAAASLAGGALDWAWPFAQGGWIWLQRGVLIVLVAALLALVYRLLTAAAVRWRDVAPGAVVAALLLALARFLVSAYIAHSSVVSVYGAAGSLVVLLLWIYVGFLILLLGAEVCRATTERRSDGDDA